MFLARLEILTFTDRSRLNISVSRLLLLQARLHFDLRKGKFKKAVLNTAHKTNTSILNDLEIEIRFIVNVN